VAQGKLKGPTVRFIIGFVLGIDSLKNISQRYSARVRKCHVRETQMQ
jgi:hypothetical protein